MELPFCGGCLSFPVGARQLHREVRGCTDGRRHVGGVSRDAGLVLGECTGGRLLVPPYSPIWLPRAAPHKSRRIKQGITPHSPRGSFLPEARSPRGVPTIGYGGWRGRRCGAGCRSCRGSI